MPVDKIKTTIGYEKEKTTLNVWLVQLMNNMISPYSPSISLLDLYILPPLPHPMYNKNYFS